MRDGPGRLERCPAARSEGRDGVRRGWIWIDRGSWIWDEEGAPARGRGGVKQGWEIEGERVVGAGTMLWLTR